MHIAAPNNILWVLSDICFSVYWVINKDCVQLPECQAWQAVPYQVDSNKDVFIYDKGIKMHEYRMKFDSTLGIEITSIVLAYQFDTKSLKHLSYQIMQ